MVAGEIQALAIQDPTSVLVTGIALVETAILLVALIAVVAMLRSQNLLISLEEVVGEARNDQSAVQEDSVGVDEAVVALEIQMVAQLTAKIIRLMAETPQRKSHARCTFLQNQPTTKPKCSPIIFSRASISTNLIRFQ
jgi:hypothetical protein